MKVVGIRDVNFKGQDGTEVYGKKFYCLYEPVNDKNLSGCATDCFFLSAARLNELQELPQVNDDIEVNYNRFGKVSSITIL